MHTELKAGLVEPPEREGHNVVRLLHDRLILTGGYTTDDNVYILDFDSYRYGSLDKEKDFKPQWKIARPTVDGFDYSENVFLFAYGCSLTPINSTQMIRFGGFQAGGYSQACNEVLLLTVEDAFPGRPDLIKMTRIHATMKLDFKSVKSKWTKIITQGNQPTCRAYHTATLLCNRYLVIVGGMTDGESIMEEAILDTHTWTWLGFRDEMNTTARYFHANSPHPSPRHGHSVILDESRDRLVLFGGGSGGDLLRDGQDNTEVWELLIGKRWKTNFQQSFPWRWRIIQRDHNDDNDQSSDSNNEGVSESSCSQESENYEHPSLHQQHVYHHSHNRQERLNLGRCHISVKLEPNNVLFFSGGGQVSTNNCLMYHLPTNKWKKLKILGRAPLARFTSAGTVIDGYLVAEGGFSSINGTTLKDVMVLDLIPNFNRIFQALPEDKRTG